MVTSQYSMLSPKRRVDFARKKNISMGIRDRGDETIQGVIVWSLLLLYRKIDDNSARADGQSKS